MLVNPAKKEDYNKVVAYIRSAEFQKAMAETTLRRPVNPDVQVEQKTAFPLVELPFPGKLAVVDAILTAYNNQFRLPADSSFVLDLSGSMADKGRIEGLQTAMLSLSGADASLSGRFARFRNRERIFLVPFSTTVGVTERYDMGNDEKTNNTTMATISQRIKGLRPDGNTALFAAVQQAYTEAAQRRRNDPARFYSIVPITDGGSNTGIDMGEFTNWYNQLPASDKGIKVFPVLFGEARVEELKQLAELTGGKVFDGRKSSLQAISKEIRGYQ
jgi:Ca-activated chloride channel family protein